ncbi:hypothetical protein BVRB_8g188300 [Beta vulgaris subsp. vulgaris]|nr:hypothetical protein BVRB_8g188300 [Beta vulgaris subsp. vulgaris]
MTTLTTISCLNTIPQRHSLPLANMLNYLLVNINHNYRHYIVQVQGR